LGGRKDIHLITNPAALIHRDSLLEKMEEEDPRAADPCSPEKNGR